MKRFGFTIAAILAAFTFCAASSASAAAAAAKQDPFNKEQLARGAKDVPPLLTGASIPCTVSSAGFISEGTTKNPDDPKAAEVKVASYEVACQAGMGYILQNYAGIPLKVYDCVSLSESPSPCRLPENADTKKLLATVMASTGQSCTIANERAMGATKAGDRFYEVSCSEGPGYIIQASAPSANKPAIAEDCSRAIGTNMECKFTTKEQITAALTAKMTSLVAASGKTCAVSGSRIVGADTTGTTYYEVACGTGSGYIFAEKDGKFARSIDCANANAIAGGCTLTDTTKAESAESGTYTRLATAGGYKCDVAKYRYIGVDTKSSSEVVELKCTNRPDGVLALFPTDNKGRARFYDCIAAGALGETCKLSDPAASYPKYTAELVSKGKTTCKVSGAKWLALTTDGQSFVETACSDGLPGWVVAQSASGTISEILTCGQAKSAGVACTLPTNMK